ncbi:MAG: ATP-binding protein [Muribaculaceae bacterium]|nr:ATP-binding protein [Muribaculaceae bacterium]
MIPYFNIIQSLCRACFSSDTDVKAHQIERLITAYRKDGCIEEAKQLEKLLHTTKNKEIINSSIITSSSHLHGELLTPKTIIPVDKETSAPLVEIIFVDEMPLKEPIFDTPIKDAINSVILDWSNYEKLIRLEAVPSRSCLIYGLPGTGKTHLAKWMAKKLGLPIVKAKLDGIVSSFLGTSSRNIGSLFTFANRYKCILLLDEFDAIAKLRNDPQEVGEVKRIVNTLLQCLDFRDEIGFTIGITNHEQLLDPAIWRRFDVQIEIPKPSISVIPILLQNFISPLNYNDAEIAFLSWCMQDSSGADIKNLSNWLKRMSIIDEYKEESLYQLLQRYILLNTGRISDKVKTAISQTPDNIYTNLKTAIPDLKQKDIAEIFKMTPSSFCKMIQKNNKTE